ncbi:hypothetical protein FTO68_02350 [Methanocalculus taiwanensis]|uniref:Abortive phage infection protein C-terminal domain-containing protein n=1 Tax=Methanocalculus taiwanensis TaxID=106207 RepID=A0ABD4TKM3_9EURY|nr:AIPR family protein [Methanocalculus taiwanensis]MCQ1537830.1 hypothetical protein [Methanocalculus taiwanensis]
MANIFPSEAAYRENHDLIRNYTNNSRLLFALQIKYQIEDIDSVAAECLTDGPDDRKCDMVYINIENKTAIIAQSYEGQNYGSHSAPGNKATDLNGAVSWILSSNEAELPERLIPATRSLKTAIINNHIKYFYIWYVHNCNESDQIKSELKNVERTAKSLLDQYFLENDVQVISLEIGINTLEEWYHALNTPILVNDNLLIDIKGGYEINTESWKSYITAIPAKILFELYQKHKTDLFSANIRDYLGSRNSDKNINSNIKFTAISDPENFFIYNNGITALVNNYTILSNHQMQISGVSILNGAQTSGSIGSLDTSPDANVLVPTRFVHCTNQDILMKIIEYNNTQNKIKPSDFRSHDRIQKRLRDEFKEIPNTEYNGGRRGSSQDIIRRPTNLMPSDAVAQSLASFHGNPTDAYNKKSALWEDDLKYNEIFNDSTSAKHIVFVYSLLRSIEKFKSLLKQNDQTIGLKEIEKEELKFLRERGSILLLLGAIASSIEVIVDRPVPNKFALSFSSGVSYIDGINYWMPIVEATIPYCDALKPAAISSIQNKDKVNDAMKLFSRHVASTKAQNQKIFSYFSTNIE